MYYEIYGKNFQAFLLLQLKLHGARIWVSKLHKNIDKNYLFVYCKQSLDRRSQPGGHLADGLTRHYSSLKLTGSSSTIVRGCLIDTSLFHFSLDL